MKKQSVEDYQKQVSKLATNLAIQKQIIIFMSDFLVLRAFTCVFNTHQEKYFQQRKVSFDEMARIIRKN